MIPTARHSRKGKTMAARKGSALPGLEGRDEQVEHGGFLGQRKYSECWWWIHSLVHLSKPTERTPSRVSPSGDSGLWVIMTCNTGSQIGTDVPGML